MRRRYDLKQLFIGAEGTLGEGGRGAGVRYMAYYQRGDGGARGQRRQGVSNEGCGGAREGGVRTRSAGYTGQGPSLVG